MSDPAVYAIPIRECGEPLVDVRERADLLVDRRVADADGLFALVRAGVYERLARAAALLPDGMRLVFVEGYRDPERQRSYFDEYSAELRAGNPGWDEAQVRSAASRYVSPPDNAPHCAGAAVDLTLADGQGRELDMGCELNASPEESDGACYSGAPNVSTEGRRNRQVLGEALSRVGLVNYPTEWWHWSYGDRYWALMTGAGEALYGVRGGRR